MSPARKTTGKKHRCQTPQITRGLQRKPDRHMTIIGSTLTKSPPENTELLLSAILKDPPLSRTEGADP